MTSCGDISLRRIWDGHTEWTDVKPDTDLVVRALTLYRDMQQATVPHVDAFIAAGVPDWRLDKLPGLYRQLVDAVALLQEYGLSEAQIAALQSLAGAVEANCKALAAFGIDACLNHADLHDDNMMFDTATQKISFIDLGETVIAHPFLSMATILDWFKRGYRLDAHSQEYLALREGCYRGWMLPETELATAISLADDLSLLYWILAQRRLCAAIGQDKWLDETRAGVKRVLLLFSERLTAP